MDKGIKINLAKQAGFCFGVKRAIDIVFKTAVANKNIYMLSDIVHNENVVREIEKSGIKRIKMPLPAGRNKTLLISAHGVGRKTLNAARRRSYKIIDATCPMVKEIHRIVRDSEKKGRQIIIIGDKLHSEVRGISGQLTHKAIIIDNIRNIPLKALKKIKKCCVVVQSTQNLEKTLQIVGILKLYIQDLEFFNTICLPTRLRQEEIRRLPQQNDVMIIIGSKKSANTRRLYEISKSLNKKSYWINSKNELRREWFKAAKSIGISAGASTPDSTTRSIISSLRKLTYTP